MPKGPQGQKRPADVIGADVMVGKIATGEIHEKKRDPGTEANRKGGLKGGKARAQTLSPDRRTEIARKAAKACLPWHARRMAASCLEWWAKRKPPFAGVYAQFSDVGIHDFYDTEQWSLACRDAVRQAAVTTGSTIPSVSAPGKWLLPFLVATMSDCPVRILDFGGGAGLDYVTTAALSGRRSDIVYHVVDVSAACKAGEDVLGGTVTYSSELPDSTASFDIIYAYSAIHFVPDFRDLLRRLARYRAKFILLCKHPVRDGNSFVRAQVNVGASNRHAQWVMSLADISEALPGYHLGFSANGTDVYNVDNYAEEYRVGGTAILLFVKDH